MFDQLKDVLSAQPPWSKDVELYRQKWVSMLRTRRNAYRSTLQSLVY